MESIRPLSEEELLAAGVSPDTIADPNYVRARPVLDDIDLFDARFFGYSPKMAAAMGPQFRLFLECAWAAIENAGYDTDRYDGAVGLHCGASLSTYLVNNLYANPRFMTEAGEFNCYVANLPDSLATRVAYKLNLRGACYTIHTFCSTSLVAVHTACQSLLNCEMDMALAGGVSIFTPQNTGYRYEEGLIVSPDGHCRPFDAQAQGTVFGSGLGVLVLKRLEDAVADRDTIHAVILGSATNNDGSLKVSYTAPSVDGQAQVIAEALSNAGVEPGTISYVEAHGTGTALGDPTEITALAKAFGGAAATKRSCAIGSVKSNIGHLDAASGIAGLIKTVLALEHHMIPPSLHFERPNPGIDFDNTPFYVNAKLAEWKVEGTPRRAGVSSFGVGGTNAHVVLQESSAQPAGTPSRPCQLLLLSARTETALDAMTRNLSHHLKANPETDPADAAFTLQVGRKVFDHRRMLVCRDTEDAATALLDAPPDRIFTEHQEKRATPVVFLFTGQGSQYANMGKGLYESEPVFRECIDHCARILMPELKLDLKELLYPEQAGIEEAGVRLAQTSITQPALFAIEYAVSRLWMSWGVKPQAVIGHSIGEYVAACIAGVFSLEDGLSLVAARGRLIQGLQPGSMLAVRLSEKDILPYLDDETSLATVNSPLSCVVSGATPAIDRLEKTLAAEAVDFRRLKTSHAFHSSMMEPIIDTFAKRVGEVELKPPDIPFLSNVSGTWIEPDEAASPRYWTEHLRRAVRFSDAVGELLADPNRILLEVGPGNTLVTLVRQHQPLPPDLVLLSSIRHPKEDRLDTSFMLTALGRLWLAGAEVDWSGFHAHETRRRIHLPPYPFDRQRHWVDPVVAPCGFPAWQAGLSQAPMDSDEIQADDTGSDSPSSGEPVRAQPAAAEAQSTGINSPVTDVQKGLADIWHRLLGVRQIGIDDNYFELGGDSVLAVRMFTQIEKAFGKKIPLAALLDKPTIRGLTPLIDEEGTGPSWSSLVTLNASGSKPALFLMHSHGGNVLEYYPLAHRLGPNQPVYALQSRGLDGTPIEEPKIEEMAAYYLKEIRAVQPNGPYYLGGFCFGGLLALEAAQQLQASGEAVELLALINASIMEFPHYRPGVTVAHRLVYAIAYRLALEWANLSGKPLRERWVYGLARLRRTWDLALVRAQITADKVLAAHDRRLPRHTTVHHLEQLAMAHDRAWLAYEPSPYDGRVLFFRASRQYFGVLPDPLLGWKDLLVREVERYDVPGFRQNMLDEAFVGTMADILKAALNAPPGRREQEG